MKTVTVELDGLLLFCFPSGAAPVQTHCEVKVLTETGTDPHEVIIKWPGNGGVGTISQVFTHNEISKIGRLRLYVDIGGVPAPEGIQLGSFDLLDLQGPNFYGPGGATIKRASYGASFFVANGKFEGTHPNVRPILRVSRSVFKDIISTKPNSGAWPVLSPDDKSDLPDYHRSAEAKISLDVGQSLVLLRGDNKTEIFRLPYAQLPSDPKVSISNLDKLNPGPSDAKGCMAFIHHAAAFTHAKPDWGLWPKDLKLRLETESGCCECGKAGETPADPLPPVGP